MFVSKVGPLSELQAHPLLIWRNSSILICTQASMAEPGAHRTKTEHANSTAPSDPLLEQSRTDPVFSIVRFLHHSSAN